MEYFAVVRRIYKNNGKMPYETIIMPNLFKTFEDACGFAKRDADNSGLRYGYRHMDNIWDIPTMLQTVHNSKTGKDTLYTHEWNIQRFKMEEEQ